MKIKSDNFDLLSSREVKEKDGNNIRNDKLQELKEKDYPKPVIKRDSGERVNNLNIIKKKNINDKELQINNNLIKEKEIENNYNNLKRNLSNCQNLKEHNRPGLLINPNFVINNEKGKKLNLEIDSRTPTPKLDIGKFLPDSKNSNDRRSSDKEKKNELASNNVYENLKKNNFKRKEYNINQLKESKGEHKELNPYINNKKINENPLNQPNLNNNEINTERKRSGSKGSANDDNNKEKPILLKDFMKNMKENVYVINLDKK
jgi:hypothetical protein